MQFKEIIGQKAIREKLIRSVSENRIAHAQLFLGPEGSGALPLAIAYAQYINCNNRTADDSCGVCPSCSKFQKLIHPDLHFVFPVVKLEKKGVSDDFIETWRSSLLQSPYLTYNGWLEAMGSENKQGGIFEKESDEIIRKLSLKTYEADYKVMIIWQADRMNTVTSNKLLKMLEEPPQKTIFLLISENTGQILPTILSRTQLIKIPKILDEDMKSYLKSNYTYSDTQLTDFVHLADGNIVKALNVMQNDEENAFNFDRFVSLMRLSYTRDVISLIQWAESMTGTGRERQKNFFSYALRLVRENFILNCKTPDLALLTQRESEFSSKFFPYINQNNVYDITAELNKAQYHIEANGSDRIIFLDLALKMVKLIKK
jgi:DNA polymerase-3 subunit delta'